MCNVDTILLLNSDFEHVTIWGANRCDSSNGLKKKSYIIELSLFISWHDEKNSLGLL